MRGGDEPSKSNRIAIVEVLNEKEKGIMAMGPQQEDIINKPESKVRFRVFRFQKVLFYEEQIQNAGNHTC